MHSDPFQRLEARQPLAVSALSVGTGVRRCSFLTVASLEMVTRGGGEEEEEQGKGREGGAPSIQALGWGEQKTQGYGVLCPHSMYCGTGRIG